MHHGAITAGVLTGKLVAVQAVGDGLTHLLGIGGEHTAVKLKLAIAVAHIGSIGGLAFLNQIQTGVDGVAAGAAV